MPLAPQAPYDSLATVTEMVRVLLGDFIQNVQPDNAGTVNTNGTALTWVSGNQFTALMNDVQIILNGVPNTIARVTSPTTAVLLNSAGVQNGIAFSLVVPTGDIFADSQPYVVPTVNLAWRRLQTKLADKGYARLESTTVLSALPVIANLDPSSEQYLTWTGFFDGANFNTPVTLSGCPVLPQDFLSPLHLDERQSVSGATANNPNLNVFRPMHPAANGLPSRAKGSWNRYFDWRDDGLFIPGSILLMDIKMRYSKALPNIVPGVTFEATPIPILNSAEALANYTCSIFVTPRGGAALAQGFDTDGDANLAQITNQQAKLQQRASYHRKPWGRRFRRA